MNNEYNEEYDEETGPPMPLDMNKVTRTILADKPRVTRFQIPWGEDISQEDEQKKQQQLQQQQQQQQQQEDNHMEDMTMDDSMQGCGSNDAAMISTE